MQSFQKVRYDMGDWIEMPLQTVNSRGLYQLCILYVFVVFFITYVFGLALNVRNMQQLQVME